MQVAVNRRSELFTSKNPYDPDLFDRDNRCPHYADAHHKSVTALCQIVLRLLTDLIVLIPRMAANPAWGEERITYRRAGRQGMRDVITLIKLIPSPPGRRYGSHTIKLT
jgi:hypothetical protein